jgi:hypothetical protein
MTEINGNGSAPQPGPDPLEMNGRPASLNGHQANGHEFTPTRIWWYNDADGAKIGCVAGRYEDIPYGSVSAKQFHAAGKPPHPQYGQFQQGYACSRTSLTIFLDGDYPEQWEHTATGKLLGPWRDVATCARSVGDGSWKFHVIIIVPPHLVHLWPKQRPAPFGHVKSNGLCYVEGVHATGTLYLPTSRPWITADEALMRALAEDNGGHLHTEAGTAHGDSVEDEAAEWADPDGEYPDYLADAVLGNWIEGTRDDSLPERCGIIKAAGEKGTAGMRALFSELCAEYDAETGRGDGPVHRAFGRCHPAHGKIRQLGQDAMLPAEWQEKINGRAPRAAALLAGANGDGQLPPASAVPAAGGSPVPFVFDPRTAASDQDLADACLFAVGRQYRFAADAGLWLCSGPEKWEALTADVTSSVITELADFMPHGLSKEEAGKRGMDPDSPETRAAIGQHARRERLRSAKGASGVASKMRARVAVPGRHPLTVRLADLDADPRVIWAGGTCWDIAKSGSELTEAETDPDTPHLHSCGYAPVVMPTPLWDTFTGAVFPWPDVREWALDLLSLGVTGYADKAVPLLLGRTDTGKTSVVDLAASVLGDYADIVAPELLAAGAGAAMQYARFDLKGVRLAFLDEAPRSGKLAQEALKNLTGGGDLKGRPPYGKPVSFRASHTLIATANPESDPPLTDEAVAGRIRLIPGVGDVAAVRAAREAIGPKDGETWRAEAPGVLAALIMRAAGVLADPGRVRRDRAPEVVQLWGDHMAAEQDSVGQWFGSATEPSVTETRGKELHEDYAAWCDRSKQRPESPVTWGRRMAKLGCPGRQSNGVTWYPRRLRGRMLGWSR